MDRPSSILIIGTCDTKADEIVFMCECATRDNAHPMVMDVSVLGDPPFRVDFSKHDVAAAAGTSNAAIIDRGDENRAMTKTAEGACNLAVQLHAEHIAKQGNIVTPALPVSSAWTEYTLEHGRIFAQLRALGVRLRRNWLLADVHSNVARFVCPNTGELAGEVQFKSLVVVGARRPSDAPYAESTDSDSCRVARIGDCLVPGTIQAALSTAVIVLRASCAAILLAGGYMRREQSRLSDSE